MTPTLPSQADEAAIHHIVADIEQGFNDNGPEPLVRHIAPDVVVAHKSAWATRQAADNGEPPQMNALYVFAKREGAWWIVRRQNTTVRS